MYKGIFLRPDCYHLKQLCVIRGYVEEQEFYVAIFVPSTDLTSLAGRRQAIKKKFPEFSYLEDLYFSKSIVENYIKM